MWHIEQEFEDEQFLKKSRTGFRTKVNLLILIRFHSTLLCLSAESISTRPITERAQRGH
jgi:hypothetical protein